MKTVKTIFFLLIMLIVVLVFLELIPIAPKFNGENPWLTKDTERPLIIPHGGAKLLYPENTAYAYQALALAHYDVFEVDLCLTSDDKLVTMHDLSFNNRKIRDYTYSQLTEYNHAINFRDLNGNTPFATITNAEALNEGLVPALLEDLFSLYGDKRFVLELKDIEEPTSRIAVRELVKLINQYGMTDKVLVSSFGDEVVKMLREENPALLTIASTNEALTFVLESTLYVDFFYSPKDAALFLPHNVELTAKEIERIPSFLRSFVTTYDEATNKYYTKIDKKSIIDDAHRHNMAVFYWTVNDKEEMRKLISLGVDGIITDRPDILQVVLDEME